MKRTPLARRTPLQAKTGLGRGSSRLETRKPLETRTRVKPRSAKREAAMVERRALVADLLKRFPRCQIRWACQGAKAVDVHERLKRSRGGSIVDERHGHMVTACRACHDLTETQPAEATRRRMLLPSWHECPPIGPC